jgi:hypothetical protein
MTPNSAASTSPPSASSRRSPPPSIASTLSEPGWLRPRLEDASPPSVPLRLHWVRTDALLRQFATPTPPLVVVEVDHPSRRRVMSPPAAGRGECASVRRATGPSSADYRFCQYVSPALGHGGQTCDCMTRVHVD